MNSIGLGLSSGVRTAYFHTGEVRSRTDEANQTTNYGISLATDPGWSGGTDISEVDSTTDPLLNTTVTKLDLSGDVVQRIGPGGAVTAYGYGKLGRLDHVTGPARNSGDTGVQTWNVYDDNGNLTSTVTGPTATDPVHATTTTFNKLGQVTDTWGPTGDTQPAGVQPGAGVAVPRTHTQFGYDAAGRKIWQLEGADAISGDPARLLTGYQYDGAGRLWRTIVHRRAYDDTSAPYALGTGSAATDEVAETRYTLAGRTRQTITPPANAATFAWATQPLTAKRVTTIGFDGAGRQSSSTDALGKTTTTVFDLDGRALTVTAPFNGATSYVTSYIYDAAGHVTTVTTPSGLPAGQSQTVEVVKTYDARGMVATETDPHTPGSAATTWRTRSYRYNIVGQLDQVTDANLHIVTYGYDGRGNRTTRTSKDDQGNAVVEDWVFDPANNLTGQTLPHSLSAVTKPGTTFHYDAYGRQDIATDDSGRTTTRTFFNAGPVRTQVSRVASDPTAVTCNAGAANPKVYCFSIDSRGRVTKQHDATGATGDITTIYNQTGQLLSVNQGSGALTYKGDLLGNNLTLTYPDTTAYQYLHDANGRLSVISTGSGSTWQPIASYTYNDGGILTNEALSTQSFQGSRSYTPNSAGQPVGYNQLLLSQIDTHNLVGAPTSYFDTYSSSINHRPDGRLADETITNNGTTTKTGSTFTVTNPGTTAPTNRYNYDNAGQLCTVTTATSPAACGTTSGTTEAYIYGTRGNRLTKTLNGSTTTNYTTNHAAELTTATVTGGPTTTYTYDNAGRRTNDTTTQNGATTGSVARTFDATGNPTSIATTDTSGTNTETRAYRADGLIGKYTSDANSYANSWDTNRAVPQIIDSKVNGTVWNRYILGNEPLQFDPAGTIDWYKLDIRGSAIASYTTTGTPNPWAVPAPDNYDSYGNPTNTNNSLGQYRGAPNRHGTINLQHRDYDPTTGTSTTRDPLDGVSGTTTVGNPYAYGYNDPLNQTDPTGLRASDSDLNCGVGEEAMGTPGSPSLHESTSTVQCVSVPGTPPDPLMWGINVLAKVQPEKAIGAFLALLGASLTPDPFADADAASKAIAAVRTGASFRAGCARSSSALPVGCLENVSRFGSIAFIVNPDADAYTQAHFVFCRQRCEGDLLLHELVHVDQWESYGDGFALMYLDEARRKGSGCDNRFERPAYEKNWPCPH